MPVPPFSESFAYDGEGNVLSHTDLRGAVSQMTYDNLGRALTTVVQDDQQPISVVTIAYNDALSKETRTDAHVCSSGHGASNLPCPKGSPSPAVPPAPVAGWS